MCFILFSLSQSYKHNYIEAGDEFGFYYVTKVFSGWDHSINDPKAAILKHKSLFKEFQVGVYMFSLFVRV